MTAEESLQERIVALEATVAELCERLDRATNRDIPLLTGTVRAAIDANIDDLGELPDTGRAFHQRIETYDDRLEAAEEQLAGLGDVGTSKTTKEQKLAAILHFAVHKGGTRSQTVAVTADEIQGCVGVSRRYAYDLIEAVADECAGVRLREATEVQTSTGVEHKKKALLVDCETVHTDGDGVKEFTTVDGDGGDS